LKKKKKDRFTLMAEPFISTPGDSSWVTEVKHSVNSAQSELWPPSFSVSVLKDEIYRRANMLTTGWDPASKILSYGQRSKDTGQRHWPPAPFQRKKNQQGSHLTQLLLPGSL
jgi:hypothetical protein